jgi:hypothetical protein
MIEDARSEFERAMRDATNLVESHRALNPGVGRRFRELSINRAIVVFTVAAWQAYLEDLLAEIVDYLEPPAGDPAVPRFRVIRADTTYAINRFSTPSAEGARDLLIRGGFDPLPHWHWAGRWPLTIAQTRDRMNQWLRVRHAIAHGDPQLPAEPVLSVRPSGEPTLTLDDAEACITFFRRLVEVTTNAAVAAHP